MLNFTPAEVFPPGEFLREELEERGWTQLDLAEIIDKTPAMVNEIITGKRAITPETARLLSEALGTSAKLWMNLESTYRLSRVTTPPAGGLVSRRAQLYVYPIRDMVRRGWIGGSSNIEVLEHQVAAFFRKQSIQDVPHFSHAAKKSGDADPSPTQLAWLSRVRQLAEILSVSTYSRKKLEDALPTLRLLTQHPEEIKRVSKLLSEAGVRFLVVEALPGSRIDGVCFWLNKSSPVIAMTLRYDRVDNFWFVLRHEIEHVLRRDGKEKEIIDSELEKEGTLAPGERTEEEIAANKAAAEFCVPGAELTDFIARVGPYYSAEGILNFAKRIQVHPGLVVGQLHHRKELLYSYHVKYLVKVRHFVIDTAFSDGWGRILQINPVGTRRK